MASEIVGDRPGQSGPTEGHPKESSREFELIPNVTGVVLDEKTALSIDVNSYGALLLIIYTANTNSIFQERNGVREKIWPKEGDHSKSKRKATRVPVIIWGNDHLGKRKAYVGDHKVEYLRSSGNSHFINVTSPSPIRPLLISDESSLNILVYMRKKLKSMSDDLPKATDILV